MCMGYARETSAKCGLRDGLKRGIVTLCIGGGQGMALVLEML